MAVASVHGRASNKAATIAGVLRERDLRAADAVFIDDNISNVQAVHESGIRSFWATWGWQQDEALHLEAAHLGIPAINLADVHRISVQAASTGR